MKVLTIHPLVIVAIISYMTAILNPVHAESEATRLLKARSAEFNKAVIKVTDNVYTVVGHSVQPPSMIVGKRGIIIVDTGIDKKSARSVLAEFRKITDKPIKAVIFTHGHPDHIGGAAVFASESKRTQVWARSNHNQEAQVFKRAGITYVRKRGARQAGFLLPPEQRINNGVAQAYFPERGGAVFASDAKSAGPPTHFLGDERKKLKIAGVNIELVPVEGETYDGLYVWLPLEKVVFAGDNFYKSWPNLYAIRGVPYRDVKGWYEAIDMMLQEGPEHLVGGHTRPIGGKAKVKEVMTNYRDAIKFIFDKTVAGINKGMTPDELVQYARLPKKYQELDYLREYYGNVEWGVRSIFNGYMGWFDGNATNLFSLPPREEAERMAKLAGGVAALLEAAENALAAGDNQWAAQLADHLIALDAASSRPKLLKADALTALAKDLLTATGRNYYLTSAMQLRKAAAKTISKEQ